MKRVSMGTGGGGGSGEERVGGLNKLQKDLDNSLAVNLDALLLVPLLKSSLINDHVTSDFLWICSILQKR